MSQLPEKEAVALVEEALEARLKAESIEEIYEKRFQDRTPSVMEVHGFAMATVFANGYPVRDGFVVRSLRFLAARNLRKALKWVRRLEPHRPSELEAFSTRRHPGAKQVSEVSVEAVHAAMLAWLRAECEAEAWHAKRVAQLLKLKDNDYYKLFWNREYRDPESPAFLREERALVAAEGQRGSALDAFRDAWKAWVGDGELPLEHPNLKHLPKLAIAAAKEDPELVLTVLKAHWFLHDSLFLSSWAAPLAEQLTPELAPFVVRLMEETPYRLGTDFYTTVAQGAMAFLPGECQAPLLSVVLKRIGVPCNVWRGGPHTDYPTWESPLPKIVCQLPALPEADQLALSEQLFDVVALMRGMGNHSDTRKLVRKLLALYPQSDSVKALGKRLWAHSLVAHFAEEARGNLAWQDATDDDWRKPWRTFLRLRRRVERLGEPAVEACYHAAEAELRAHPRIAGAEGH